MAATWILKLPQVDKPEQPVLVHVAQKQETIFDLDLIATDGNDAYKGKVRQRSLSKLQSRNFEGTDEEWCALLRYVFVFKKEPKVSEEHIRNLEVDCMISGEEASAKMSITLRHRVEDITHKLGTVELSYLEDTTDVDLFSWACQLADQRDRLSEEAATSGKEAKSTKDTISNLQTQLSNLVKAKEDHEDQLLTKFAALLNEKKLKVRDYQRTLSTAKMDRKAYNEVRSTLDKDKSTRSAKRKRGNENVTEKNAVEDEESDAFEAMDVDQEPVEQAQDDTESGGATPSRAGTPETETASEDEETTVPVRSANNARPRDAKASKSSPPPPPRRLPFQSKVQKAESTAQVESSDKTNLGADVETESEDDEL